MTLAVKTEATKRKKSKMLKRLKPIKLSGFVQQLYNRQKNFKRKGSNSRPSHRINMRPEEKETVEAH